MVYNDYCISNISCFKSQNPVSDECSLISWCRAMILIDLWLGIPVWIFLAYYMLSFKMQLLMSSVVYSEPLVVYWLVAHTWGKVICWRFYYNLKRLKIILMAFSSFLFLWNHKERCVVNSFGSRMVRVWLRKSNRYA